MSGDVKVPTWRFFKSALFVTGDGERDFLPTLFRPLTADGDCHFRVVHQLSQRSPISAKTRQLKMVGRGQVIPDKDEEDIGLKARKYLAEGFDFIVLVDDLEQARADIAEQVYNRYRAALDVMLRPLRSEVRASAHFLVNMLEAYYFADVRAVNAVLGTNLTDFDGDVETIGHPKNELKAIARALGAGRSFDEIKDGRAILEGLDVAKVLSHPGSCRSLRTAFAWCWRAMGKPPTGRFQPTGKFPRSPANSSIDFPIRGKLVELCVQQELRVIYAGFEESDKLRRAGRHDHDGGQCLGAAVQYGKVRARGRYHDLRDRDEPGGES